MLGGLNHQPVGTLTISDPNPTEDQRLTVSIAGVTDADNAAVVDPVTGAVTHPITGTVSYFWQGELSPGVFQDIMFFGAGETQRAVGTSFTPTEPFVGGVNFASLTGVRLACPRRLSRWQRRVGAGVLRSNRACDQRE